MTISFHDQVAIVTGAGGGLGRSHALELAKRGAKVVVNDVAMTGSTSIAAEETVNLIKEQGGKAFADGANVTDFEQIQAMVEQTMSKWGRVDVLINNAGILRDKSFSKMPLDEFKSVLDVHVMGSVNCTKAVWDIMRDQNYGRIVMTTSSSGMYGNFGQTNYGAAKTALIGLMNVLVIEGAKHDIRVNALAPTAGTQMTEGLIPDEIFKLLTPEAVTAAAIVLCHKDAPNKMILCAGAGGYSRAEVTETEGIFLNPDKQTPEDILANWDALNDSENQKALNTGPNQLEKFMTKALSAQSNKT